MDLHALPPGHLNETLEGEISLTYEARGISNCGLLLLPGWCESRAVFAPLIGQLESQWRILSADLPGHGASPLPAREFGLDDIAAAAIEAIGQSGLERVIPVTHSHAGWVAIELRRRLGRRIPGLALLDWQVLDPPAAFVDTLRGLQDPERWRDSSEQLFATWLDGSASLSVARHVVRDLAMCEPSMWARAAREIERAYRLWGNPLKALAALEPGVPTVHIYAQPGDDGYLRAQQEFARSHAWFMARRVAARTHFPMLEVPEQVASAIRDFAAANPQESRNE
jgi:pimeloyl-ACP methyl ester carboxylesterase